MNPETMLEKVCRSLDILIALGATYEGLFPSIIDRSTHQMMTKMPPGIAGQRDGDRSHLGSNMIHDQTALKTCTRLPRRWTVQIMHRRQTGICSGLQPTVRIR